MTKHICSLIVLSVALTVVSGCGQGQEGPVERSWGRMKGLEKFVGNMNDTSVRTLKPRPNALGEPVAMTEFEGNFVWAQYAAPWCKACTWQARETKKVEEEMKGTIVFLTIMTSKGHKYNDHATVDTARAWASRFGLDPKRVLAAQLSGKVIPEHRLFSPQGHTLFVHVGSLSANQIREVIWYYKTGYDNWSRTGKRADWMAFK